MLLVIAFCHKDARQAAKLLQWMFELDGQDPQHRCLVVAAKGIKDELALEVEAAAKQAFVTAKMVHTTVVDERGWPQSCNTLFTCAASYIHDTLKCPFWWNEPDCVPLKSGWLTVLEEEYKKGKKPFMGSVVHKPCTHLTGCALYPHDIGFYNHKLLGVNNPIAWDCIAPELTIQHTHHTALFQHCWDDPKTGKVATFPDAQSLSMLRDDAIIFHRNKDLTLIDRLRERRVAIQPSLESNAPPVFTYHEDIGRRETDLIMEWKRSWSAHGWNPIVLGDSDFASASEATRFLESVSKLPTINTRQYENACYKRWMAVAQRGGGVMTDYDVMNYGWTPEHAPKANGRLTFMERGIPSVVVGSVKQFKAMCNDIATYNPCPEDKFESRAHVSDMFIVQRLWDKRGFKHVDVVRQYGEPGWEKALLVHYPNARTKGNKLAAIRSHP